VFFESVEEFKYFDYNTNAKLTLLFSERIIETRTNTCDGNRPNAPFSGGYVPQCTGGGGSGDVELNGVVYGQYTAPTTFDVDVINNGSNQVGSLQSGIWLVDNTEVFINSTQVGDVVAEDTLNINVTLDGVNSGSWNGALQTWQVVSSPCANANVSVNSIFFGSVISGGNLNIPIYNRASAGLLVGSLGTGRWVIGQSPIQVNSTPLDFVSAEATYNLNVLDQNSNPIGSASGTNWVVINPIRGNFQANRGVLDTFVVDASSAGVYTGTTNDGGSGTVTILVNGVAISFPQTLAIGDLVNMSRSTTTNIGWAQLNG
jgi:hypothetical protein